MKKIIAIVLALAALTALAVTAFASGSADAAVPAATEAKTETEIEAALSEDDALAAALKDAGEKEANVTVEKNKLTEKTTEDDETIAVYTVKFSTDTTSYKYYIDATTGKVLYKSIVFQSADIVFKSHSRGDGESEGRADKASGEMGEGVTGRTGRTGGHKSASTETDTAAALTDTTTA